MKKQFCPPDGGTCLVARVMRVCAVRFTASTAPPLIYPPAGLAQTAVAFTEKRRKPRPELHSLINCNCFSKSKLTRALHSNKACSDNEKQNIDCSFRKGRIWNIFQIVKEDFDINKRNFCHDSGVSNNCRRGK